MIYLTKKMIVCGWYRQKRWWFPTKVLT